MTERRTTEPLEFVERIVLAQQSQRTVYARTEGLTPKQAAILGALALHQPLTVNQLEADMARVCGEYGFMDWSRHGLGQALRTLRARGLVRMEQIPREKMLPRTRWWLTDVGDQHLDRWCLATEVGWSRGVI